MMDKSIDPAIIKLLGGAKRETKRTEDEINQALVLIPKSYRSTLQGQDRINFVTRATIGIPQYTFALTYNNKTELDDVYSLALRVQKFREDCRRHDIDDIFEILPFDEGGQLAAMATQTSSPPSPTSSMLTPTSSSSMSLWSTSSLVLSSSSKPRNLFDNYKEISLETVKKSTRYYYEHSTQDYIIENIVWSGEKLLNSCSPELRDMILSKSLFLSQKEVGGPVYFKIMMEICNDLSSKSRPMSRASLTSPMGRRGKSHSEPRLSPESSSSRAKRKELRGVSPTLSLSNLQE